MVYFPFIVIVSFAAVLAAASASRLFPSDTVNASSAWVLLDLADEAKELKVLTTPTDVSASFRDCSRIDSMSFTDEAIAVAEALAAAAEAVASSLAVAATFMSAAASRVALRADSLSLVARDSS